MVLWRPGRNQDDAYECTHRDCEFYCFSSDRYSADDREKMARLKAKNPDAGI
jgi:hypothetical protein